MEINTLNRVQVNCPRCQKLFWVAAGDLSPGQARFKCTLCEGLFAVDWPYPPGVISVPAYQLEAKDFVSLPAPLAPMSQTCFRCGEPCDGHYSECPKCGVIFNKVQKIGPPDTGLRPQSSEVANAWEAVRAQYGDEKKHQHFIQTCLRVDNLAFASHQYRAILLANPNDEIALHMQDKIVHVAVNTYISSREPPVRKRRKIGIVSVVLILGFMFIVTGFIFPQARTLVAVGSSFIAFGLLVHFWI